MSETALHFVVPGRLEQRTGGSIYDRRMVEGLRRLGREVNVIEIAGASPRADTQVGTALAERLAGLSRDSLVVIDFWALAAAPAVARTHASRLTMLALVHLPWSEDPLLGPAERSRQLQLEREALQAFRGVIATSRLSADNVRRSGISPAHIRTVIPGTDPAPTAQGPGHRAPPRILCVASVTPGKGQDVLVQALVELADMPWTCVCAGSRTRSAAYAATVEAMVQKAGLSDRITFPGDCDESIVDGLYASSSIFVLPSRFETYGMALTEAMARGLPIVSTTAGAIPETVPAEAGLLVAPGDSRALAGALSWLLESPSHGTVEASARRARLGAAGHRHAETLPGWDRQVDVFSDSLVELASMVC